MDQSWRDGIAFCALIDHFRPGLLGRSVQSLDPSDILDNNSLAFRVAEEELGIPSLLDPQVRNAWSCVRFMLCVLSDCMSHAQLESQEVSFSRPNFLCSRTWSTLTCLTSSLWSPTCPSSITYSRMRTTPARPPSSSRGSRITPWPHPPTHHPTQAAQTAPAPQLQFPGKCQALISQNCHGLFCFISRSVFTSSNPILSNNKFSPSTVNKRATNSAVAKVCQDLENKIQLSAHSRWLAQVSLFYRFTMILYI